MNSEKTAAITAICPSSTPILKERMDVKNFPLGRPISFNELAKPIPWIRPKRKTSNKRQAFNLLIRIFSTETKTIDNAIIGSTIGLGTTKIFFILRAKVMECATVNAVACQSIGFILVLNKQSPVTKSI